MQYDIVSSCLIISYYYYVKSLNIAASKKFTLHIIWADNGQLNDPSGVAVDTKGNLYVANNRIQVFDTNGKFIRTWGTFGTGDGQFNNPGITLDYARGYVYVADSGNNRVEKFTSNGTFITKWGSFGKGEGQFNTPIGIDEDEAKQNVYVTDVGNNRVQRFASNGLFVSQWGSIGSGPGQFNNP